MSSPALPLNARLRWDMVQLLLSDIPSSATVLEIGTGQGAIGVRLASRYSSYTGVEADATSAAIAADRLGGIPGAQLLHAEVEETAGSGYDLVCAFEVLEHIEDDRHALQQWVQRARPGGHVLLSVPMGAHRIGAWDHAVGHYRRYDRDALEGHMVEAGLRDVALRSYGFPLGYALELARNAIARRRTAASGYEARTAASGRLLQPPEALGWVMAALAAPFCLLQRPFATTALGTGLVARGTVPA